jgi:DNA-binding transcriptional MerR regulator
MGDDETTETSGSASGTGTASDGADASSDQGPSSKGRDEGFDLKGIVRQLTAPMIESLDTRLRDQIEEHVDELLTEKIDAALADRLSTVDRAIADLSRSLDALERRLAALEQDSTSN